MKFGVSEGMVLAASHGDEKPTPASTCSTLARRHARHAGALIAPRLVRHDKALAQRACHGLLWQHTLIAAPGNQPSGGQKRQPPTYRPAGG